MAKGRSPTQRTLAALRDRGMLADIVERRIPGRPGQPFGIGKDYLGFIDIIALDPATPGRGIVGVQSCGQSFAEHYRKIVEERADECAAWLRAGGRVELWGWRKLKLSRGGKAMRWTPRVKDITEEDLR